MQAKVVVEKDGSTWLMTSANGWQWNGIQLRNPVEDATVICDALADLVPSRWQPIETAPRDGTEILLGWPSGSMESDGLYESSFTSATYWMPLPEPPERR